MRYLFVLSFTLPVHPERIQAILNLRADIFFGNSREHTGGFCHRYAYRVYYVFFTQHKLIPEQLSESFLDLPHRKVFHTDLLILNHITPEYERLFSQASKQPIRRDAGVL